MKTIFKIIFPVVLAAAACAGPAMNPYNLVPFESNNIDPSFLNRVKTDYETLREVPFHPRAIVLAAENLSNSKFLEQEKIIQSGAIGIEEENEFIIILALVSGTPPLNVNYATAGQAKQLLNGDPFKIIIYNTGGEPIHSSTHVMSGEEILSILNNSK